MTTSVVQIIATGPRRSAEAAMAAVETDPALESIAYSLIEIDETGSLCRIDAFPNSAGHAEALLATLAGFPELKLSIERLADADWLALSLSGLPPVRAGRFFVFGAHDLGKVPPNVIPLRIEAGAAFGTGHHGTTAGCLVALDGLLKARRFARVLDIGAGTGILAIAAARTGSHHVWGLDIDPVSVRIARENARLNGAPARFLVGGHIHAPAMKSSGPYDLVFANILARPLVVLGPAIGRALAPGGIAILSGILRSQARTVLAAYVSGGFSLQRRIRRDPWVTVVLRRR